MLYHLVTQCVMSLWTLQGHITSFTCLLHWWISVCATTGRQWLPLTSKCSSQRKFLVTRARTFFCLNKLNDTKCLCIFVLPWLFLTLQLCWTAPFDKLVPMFILIKATTPLIKHHAVVLVMFKSHASFLCPSTQSLLNRLLLERGAVNSRCSKHHGYHCLTEWQKRRLRHRAPHEFKSRLIVLSAESSPRVTSNVCMLPLQLTGNAGDCQEWCQKAWI